MPVGAAISTPVYATTYFTTEQAQRAIFPGASFTSTEHPGVWRTSTGGYFIVDKVNLHDATGFLKGDLVGQVRPNITVVQTQNK